MGSTKTEQSSGTSNSQQTVQPTAEETQLNKLRLARETALDPSILSTQQQGLDLISQLLAGGTNGGLPGFLSGLPGGISPEVTQDIVDRSLRDVRGGLQGGGLLDSGVRSALEARTSADIRTQSEQFNLQNLQQLLNIAVGGQSQVQQPILGFGSQLSQSLAGLRGINQTGATTGFMKTNNSFFSPAGLGGQIAGGFSQGLGSAAGGALFGSCWVASEIFGGWFEPKTCATRYFVNFLAPEWFKNMYLKYGKKFARFISNKPIIKVILRPIFELFAYFGGV